jgi:branched-chain amino acid transport system substrate-binding protein
MRLLCITLFAWIAAIAMPAGAAEPIRIGVVAEVTGTQAEAGQFTLNGIKLALDEINKAGGALGRPVELRIEDNASTNPGTVLAFSKLGVAHHREGGHPDHDRRERRQPHAREQSLGVPHPS